MISPAVVVKRFLPELDEQLWIPTLLIGGFAVLFLKEWSLPTLLVLAAIAGWWLKAKGSPAAPLYVLVAYLPFSQFVAGDWAGKIPGFNVGNLLILWALASHIRWQRSKGNGLFPFAPLHLSVGLFCALGAAAFFRTWWSYGNWHVLESARALADWLLPVSGYFLTVWIVRDKRTLKTVAALMMVALLAVALTAIWEYWDRAGDDFDQSRVQGVAGHANLMGAFFVSYLFPLLGFFLLHPAKRHGWLALAAFLLASRGMMVTFSRGAYLAFGVGGLIACWFRHKLLFAAVAALALMALAHPVLLPAGIRYRMQMTLKSGQAAIASPSQWPQHLEPSASRRLTIWSGALAMIREHPWWGVGLGGFGAFIPHYTQGRIADMNAHNSFFMLAAEMGLPTMLSFVAVMALSLWHAWWLYRNSADRLIQAIALGVLSGWPAMAIANLFSFCMRSQEVMGYFWILCGLIMSGVLMERQAAGKRQQKTVMPSPLLRFP